MSHPDSFLDGVDRSFLDQSEPLKIGDTVIIAENDHLLDCCQGKRGRIVHVGTGGGWLIHTDHFCPIERTNEELTLVPVTQLAREHIESVGPAIANAYRKFDSDTLKESAGRGDTLAWAILVERGSPLSG